MTGLPLLTSSEMRAFRACARQHHYAYNLLVRPVETAEALRFGTLIHAGLEAYRCACDPDERLTAALRALAEGGAADELELVKAEELLLGYDARWGDDAVEILAAEQTFAADLRNPATGATSRTYRLGGKVDAIGRVAEDHPTRQPGVYLIETKTTSEDIGVGSPYWTRLRLDTQVSVYFEGARALGYDVVGCIYDVIRKPGIRPLKATPPDAVKLKKDGTPYANVRLTDETPDEYRARLRADIAEHPDRYYQRGDVVRLEHEVVEAAYDTWQTARLIREATVTDRHVRNSDACLRWGRPCQFFPVCAGEASLDDERLYRRAAVAHEELVTTHEGNHTA